MGTEMGSVCPLYFWVVEQEGERKGRGGVVKEVHSQGKPACSGISGSRGYRTTRRAPLQRLHGECGRVPR